MSLNLKFARPGGRMIRMAVVLVALVAALAAASTSAPPAHAGLCGGHPMEGSWNRNQGNGWLVGDATVRCGSKSVCTSNDNISSCATTSAYYLDVRRLNGSYFATGELQPRGNGWYLAVVTPLGTSAAYHWWLRLEQHWGRTWMRFHTRYSFTSVETTDWLLR